MKLHEIITGTEEERKASARLAELKNTVPQGKIAEGRKTREVGRRRKAIRRLALRRIGIVTVAAGIGIAAYSSCDDPGMPEVDTATSQPAIER